jgi:6-phosphofructokinase 1
VRELQYQGGTVLGSSRGGFDADKIINALVSKGINHVYIIGGDGTHRGIAVLAE